MTENIKSKTLLFMQFLCIVLVAMICIAHVVNSNMLVLLCLGVFMMLIMWAALRDSAILFLLFFMPWAPLLRLAPDSMSFYTIGLFMSGVIGLIKHNRKLNMIYLAPMLLLFITSMVAKIAFGYSIDNSYIMFMAMLVLFPAMLEADGGYDFYALTVFLSLGIVLAALSAQRLVGYPGIAKFIDVYNWELMRITRLSGYYRDPNFYSAQITVAISGVLLLLTNTKSKKRIAVLIILAIILVYSGFLSASKSFVLIFIALVLTWIFSIMLMRGKITTKIAVIGSIFIVITYILSSTLFTELIDIILIRFGEGTDISGLTTGRSDLWLMYFTVLRNNPYFLAIGQGFTNINIAEQASHNTIIQMIYQFGVIGSVFLILWIVCYIKKAVRRIDLKHVSLLGIIVLALGCFGPWMGLDMLFFDEFFLIPFYFCFALRWLSAESGSDVEISDIIQ